MSNEQMQLVWDSIPDFERHPKLNQEMKTAGESREVVFADDGKVVDAATVENAYNQKGIQGMLRDKGVNVVKEAFKYHVVVYGCEKFFEYIKDAKDEIKIA